MGTAVVDAGMLWLLGIRSLPVALGSAKWTVRFVAPVEEIRRILRRDLLPDEPDHPRAADAYFRLGIGPVEPLDHPIVNARGRRIVFIPTILAKLRAAREINDLFHDSPLEDGLWQALRYHGIKWAFRRWWFDGFL